MKSLAIISVLALAGCSATLPVLDNRITCTVARDKAFVVSEYGPIGVASTIATADQQVICNQQPLPAPVAASTAK